MNNTVIILAIIGVTGLLYYNSIKDEEIEEVVVIVPTNEQIILDIEQPKQEEVIMPSEPVMEPVTESKHPFMILSNKYIIGPVIGAGAIAGTYFLSRGYIRYRERKENENLIEYVSGYDESDDVYHDSYKTYLAKHPYQYMPYTDFVTSMMRKAL